MHFALADGAGAGKMKFKVDKKKAQDAWIRSISASGGRLPRSFTFYKVERHARE